MSEYEYSTTVNAPADKVFAFVSDLNNLPKYLPTVHHTQPQQGERIRVQGEAAGHQYDSDGYFRVDKSAQRMEWGSDGENKYSGWMRVDEDGHASQVTVHLSFAPNPQVEQELRKPTGDRDKTIQEGLEKALASVQNVMEGQAGKVPSASER